MKLEVNDKLYDTDVEEEIRKIKEELKKVEHQKQVKRR